MSDPRLISPMLDKFTMGDPISNHNGVRCCPAIENDSDKKYIVKIISIPASNAQLEALLLSGAYTSADAAAEYFKELADGVVEEAQILEKLSQLEGFFRYTKFQVVPMEDTPGFDVYLLSPYQKTLAQLLRQESMTHLAALNLALDICAALAICRRSGYLYVDLKPQNIYIESGKSSKIGDIGFISLDSLRFASLPERYRSAYTPPEISDAFAMLNPTIDVYALGLIMYQIFNDGILPSTSDDTATAAFVPPAYADYEMAEIILKCCDPEPENRWKDPVELGQAIVAYMQRNGAHDVPIVPVATTETANSDSDTAESDIAESRKDSIQDDLVSETNADSDVSNDIDLSSDPLSSEIAEHTDGAELYTEDKEGNLTFINADETSPEQHDDEIDYTEVSNEVSDILQQADDLISHDPPEPVVVPEPIDVQIPPPIQIQNDTESVENVADENASDDNTTQIVDSTEDMPDDQADEYSEEMSQNIPRKKIHWLRNILIAVTVLAVATIGVLFFAKYYLQPIDSIVLQEHENGDLTVLVSSPVSDSKLNVICADTYGNQLVKPVVDGRAEFTGLSPDSAYTVKISIDGFHRLTGDTSAAFTTPAQTNILQFQAVTGSEDGSVILTFTVDGPDSTQWQIEYSSSDQNKQQIVFSGTQCTITGLSIGSEYKFILTPVANINYTGINELTHVASKIVKPVDLHITGCMNGVLTANWNAPEGAEVDSWIAHCYSDSGYKKMVTVNETSVSFDEIDHATAYTIEVAAAGMSVSERTFAPANSLTVSDFLADDSSGDTIKLTWNSNGYKPEDGWILLYSIDGSASHEIRNITNDNYELTTIVPDAEYVFTLQTAEGVVVFGGQTNLRTSEAKKFSGYGVSAQYMEFKMCETPSKKNWNRHDISSSDFTSTYKIGQKASFLVHLTRTYNKSNNKITTLYVIRGENGSVVSTSTTTATWTKMWKNGYCELDVPALPQTAGKYSISIYFNGALAHSQDFQITA